MINFVPLLLLILVAIVFSIKKIPQYNLIVFFSFFSGTAGISIGSQWVPLSVIVYIYILFLELTKYIINNKIRGRLTNISFFQINCLIILFVTAILSQIYSVLYLTGTYKVLDTYSNIRFYAKEEVFNYSFQYFTQLIYLFIGVTTTILILVKIRNKESFDLTIKVLLFGCFTAISWSLYEYFSYQMGLTYPTVFNQLALNATGPLILDGKIRVIGLSLEPSIFAQSLAATYPYVYSRTRKRKGFYTLLFIFILILTQSSTAKLSIVLITINYLIGIIVKLRVRSSITLVFIPVIVSVIVLSFYLFVEFFEKIDTFSGVERLSSLINGINYFGDHPLLGLGFGVYPTLDLITNLLVNVGLVGTTIFLVYIFSVFLFQGKLYRAQGISLTFLLLINQFSGFIYYTPFFWIILGLSSIKVFQSNHATTPLVLV